MKPLSKPIAYCDALCGFKYRKATWMVIGVAICRMQCGMYAVQGHQSRIYQKVLPPDYPLSIHACTFISNFFNAVFGVISLWPNNMFGRKPILLWGHAISATLLLLISASYYFEYPSFFVLFQSCFIGCFAWTLGPICWIYAAETTLDTQMGIYQFSLFLAALQ